MDIYLGQYLRNMHAVTNICMKHIYKVLYDLSVDLVTFDLGFPLKVKSRSQTCQGVVSHKWCIQSCQPLRFWRNHYDFLVPITQGKVVNTCQTFTLNYSVHQWIYINYFIKILIELGYIQLVPIIIIHFKMQILHM